MNTYKFDHEGKSISIDARNARTSQRRFRGFVRGELTIEGQTILASKRTPKGHSMRKRKE
jgi:hypothetical protein